MNHWIATASFVASALTDGEAAKQPQWYEMVAGVIAIPVTLVGVVYTYGLIRKTTLEARKISLEIAEKERALAAEPLPAAAERLLTPLANGFRGQMLILRFILLFIALGVWRVIGEAFWYGVIAAYMVAAKLLNFPAANDAYEFPAMVVGKGVPIAVEWFIWIAVGFPLLLDLAKLLNFDLRALLKGDVRRAFR